MTETVDFIRNKYSQQYLIQQLNEANFKKYFSNQFEKSDLWECPHCYCNAANKKLVGWCQDSRVYGVFECQECFEKFRHHIYIDYLEAVLLSQKMDKS